MTAPRPQDRSVSAPVGRRYATRCRVRLGDVDPAGRLRLDALLRLTQDVSDDDRADAGMLDDTAWVVRRSAVEVGCSASWDETLRCETWCSGLGRSWAERTFRIEGDAGAAYDVVTLWVMVDPATGRPVSLTDSFRAVYGPAAAGRRVKAGLVLPRRPPDDATVRAWPLRAVDYDVFGHVNNAAYVAVVEQWLADTGTAPEGLTIEYQTGVPPVTAVTIAECRVGGVGDGRDGVGEAVRLWWVLDDGQVAAGAEIRGVNPRPEPDPWSARTRSGRRSAARTTPAGRTGAR
ncbi:MAG: acyl-ACP thioesterase domain-containing protein [Acidimicrobiales bacterium]